MRAHKSLRHQVFAMMDNGLALWQKTSYMVEFVTLQGTKAKHVSVFVVQPANTRLGDLVASLEAEMTIVVQSGNDLEGRRTAKTAMNLLGRLRASEAVHVLAARTTFRAEAPGSASGGPEFGHSLPAASALIQIGLPSVKPVIELAATTDDEEVLKDTAIVIHRIPGTNLARSYIDEKLKDENELKRRSRLERVRERIGR